MKTAFDHLVEANFDLSIAARLDPRLDRVGVYCDDGSAVTLQHVLRWIAVVGARLEKEAIGQPQNFRARPRHTLRRANGQFAPRRYG